MTDRPHLTLVPPAAGSVHQRGSDWQEDWQGSAERAIADIDRALRDGPPGSPWRGCLFTLRHMLAEQAGASPLRSVGSAEGEDRRSN